MDILSCVTGAEEAFGEVKGVKVPSRLLERAKDELAARQDLVDVLEEGKDDRLVVTAGKADWYYGGL